MFVCVCLVVATEAAASWLADGTGARGGRRAAQTVGSRRLKRACQRKWSVRELLGVGVCVCVCVRARLCV